MYRILQSAIECWHTASGPLRKPFLKLASKKYVVTNVKFPVRFPEHLSFAQASVLPLACDTAMAGLYVEDFLGLKYPTVDTEPTNKTLLGKLDL